MFPPVLHFLGHLGVKLATFRLPASRLERLLLAPPQVRVGSNLLRGTTGAALNAMLSDISLIYVLGVCSGAGAVNDNTWEELVLKSPVPVLVDFWAPWCGPCRMIAPIIDELALEYGDKIRAVRSDSAFWHLDYFLATPHMCCPLLPLWH